MERLRCLMLTTNNMCGPLSSCHWREHSVRHTRQPLNNMNKRNQMFNCCKFIFNIGRRPFTCTKRLLFSAWKFFSVFAMSCLWRRDSGESVKIAMYCEGCKKHEEKNEELQKNLKQTLEKNEELNKILHLYKSDNAHLIQQNAEIKERSDNITSTMADILETKGDLENVNDEFANTKLAKQFEAIYDNKWTELSEWLVDNNPGLEELERIKALTKLSKNAYEECVYLAEEQLRKFLFLGKNDKIPSPEEEPALFKIRRYSGQQPHTRDVVKKEVIGKILRADSTRALCTEEKKAETKVRLEGFFCEFIDYCWLMTISNPRLLLEFNVVGLSYSGSVKERFKQYSCQEDVESVDMEKDTVFEVVWPSVELEDGAGIYAKGDVITVDIGKEN